MTDAPSAPITSWPPAAIAVTRAHRIPTWRRRAGTLLLWVWAPLVFVVSVSLMVGHWYQLPRPATSDAVTRQGLNGLRSPVEAGDWLAVHALYVGCRCSERILEHLLTSKRPEGVAEKLLLVGGSSPYAERARRKGFVVHQVGRRELEERYHMVALPALAVVAPEGTIRYLGGYTDTKQGPVIRDVEMIEAARAQRASRELPLFGCAVSKQLQELLDPLGLKYGAAE